MDYEKKYKEALLEARAVLEPCLKYSRGKVREALDSIDNELKRFESEDERIRQYFIWIVKNVLNNIQRLKLSKEQTIELIDNYSGIKESDMIAYLEKQKEQKPAEWSEEDEEMLEYVIGDLNDAKQLFSAKDAKDLCDKEIAWLKSLRNRPKSSDTWKPSEEQMAALEAATVRYQSTGLESLYEDLKKL